MSTSEDIPVYPAHERVCSQEADRSRQQPVHSTGEETVAEEKHARHEAVDVQLREIVPHAAQEDPDGTAAADEEGAPPPVVVL